MLEKPALPDELITACLRDAYRLDVARLQFLPLGADRDSAVYRADTRDGASYFVKLRRGFDDLTVQIPALLAAQGVKHIIPPLRTHSERLAVDLNGEFHLTLYPFIEGHGGFAVDLPDAAWIEFGRALTGIHSAVVPPELAARLPREGYSPAWRERTRGFLRQAAETRFDEPVAAALAAFLVHQQAVIRDLIERAERLAAQLRAHPLDFVLCHSDVHAGNLLLSTAGALYVVDWDNPILAPKERDLMFIGGGLGGGGHTPEAEQALFYQGYGPAQPNHDALAYYRCERIVQDIAAYCEQLLLTETGGQDRQEGLQQLTRQFLPGGVVQIALRSDSSGL